MNKQDRDMTLPERYWLVALPDGSDPEFVFDHEDTAQSHAASVGGEVVEYVRADQLRGAVDALRAGDLLADAIYDGVNIGTLTTLAREYREARSRGGEQL